MQMPVPPFVYGVPLCLGPFFSVWLHRQPSLGAGLCTLLVGLFGGLVMLAVVGLVALVRRQRPPLLVSWRSSMLQIVGMALLATFANFTCNSLFPR